MRSHRSVIHPLRNILKLVSLAGRPRCASRRRRRLAGGSRRREDKTPCWKTLINDWYDGRIDGIYPIHCYREALKHLPADVDTYSSARDDIKQALQRRIQSTKSGGGTTTTGGGQSGGGTGGRRRRHGRRRAAAARAAAATRRRRPDPGDIINAGKPAHADSLPIPLLVLGGVALVLMAAGAAGFVVRRQRLRRELAASAASFPPGPAAPVRAAVTP